MTALFISVLNMSITASIVVLSVMLIRIPLKKAPKIFSYALWGVVLFRLICPFSFESVFSLIPTLTNAIPQDIVYSQTPAIQTGVQFVDKPINTAINNALLPVNPENSVPVSPENSISPVHTFFNIAGYVWLFVFIALVLYAAIGYVLLKRRIYYATLARDNIYETDKIKTPFVLGFIRPKIYIPVGIDPSQQDYILKHEQTHIRRRDYLIKPFAFIVFALHWFNPLMWAAYFLMSKDMEMSCDEAVLRKVDEDIRGVYSSSLLGLSVKRGNLLTPLAFGESDVKSRVKNVLKFKKPSRIIIVVAVVLVALLSVGFAINREMPVLDMEPQETAQSNTILPQIMHDGIIYYFDVNGQFDILVTPSLDAPKITSTVPSTEIPRENGQANFEGSDFGGAGPVYVTYEDGLLVYWNDRWAKFVTLEQLTHGSYSETLTESLLNTSFLEAGKIEAIGDTNISGFISKDTAYLSQTTDTNICEVIFPVSGYDYFIGVSFTRESESSEWILMPVNAVNIYDPERWQNSSEVTNITVVSGRNSIEVTPESQMNISAPVTEWLDVVYDNDHFTMPFRIYDAHGVEKSGVYSVVDAETNEELDFIRPSGLAPQTSLFQNAKNGHSYIVTFTTGFGLTEKEVNGVLEISDTTTATYVFGVRLP